MTITAFAVLTLFCLLMLLYLIIVLPGSSETPYSAGVNELLNVSKCEGICIG